MNADKALRQRSIKIAAFLLGLRESVSLSLEELRDLTTEIVSQPVLVIAIPLPRLFFKRRSDLLGSVLIGIRRLRPGG